MCFEMGLLSLMLNDFMLSKINSEMTQYIYVYVSASQSEST